MYINEVEIEGFWGQHKIKTALFPDVNVFVGRNGTGKTTFMNILQGVLDVDIKSLATYEFNKVRIRLVEGKRTKTIKVERSPVADSHLEEFIYTIGSRKFPFKVHQGDLINIQRVGLRHVRFNEQMKELRLEMRKIVNVSGLSVHRTPQSFIQEEEWSRQKESFPFLIDVRLDQLITKLTRFQLSLEFSARKVSSEFEKEVLMSMLYNKDFDRWDIVEALKIEPTREKKELTKAYKELKAYDNKVQDRIDKHFSAIDKSLRSIRRSDEKKSGYDIDAFIPLPLITRTQHIVKLTKAAEEQKNEIFRPTTEYLAKIGSFIADKTFKFALNGDFQVFKGERLIPIEKLSSGEKQLLILLTETALQQGTPFVFLADEPEISLHIEWQEKIISSIQALNKRAQVIVATHSPEIAGGWNNNIIDMEDIIDG